MFGFNRPLNENQSSPPDDEPQAKKTKKESFQQKWLRKHQWLRFDDDNNSMFCEPCRKLKFNNAMAFGTTNFKTTTLERHITSSDHKAAIMNSQSKAQFAQAAANVDKKENCAITSVMKVVYWLAKECIPLTKYQSLLQLLKQLGTPNLDALKIGERIDYGSYTTACDILNALSETIDQNVTEKLHKSPAITILTDESTDICVHHKLCISARVVDPIDLKPSTLFLTDLHITSATGKGIFNAIEKHIGTRTLEGIPLDIKRVTGKKKDICNTFDQDKRLKPAFGYKKHYSVNLYSSLLAIVIFRVRNRWSICYDWKEQRTDWAVLTSQPPSCKHPLFRTSSGTLL